MGADGEGDGDHGRQPFRHDRHRHRQRHFQQIKQGLAQQPATQHHQGHQDQGATHQHIGEAIQALLQRGGFTTGGIDQLGDLAQFRAHARLGDQGCAAAPGDLGTLKDAVAPIEHRRCPIKHQLGPFLHQLRFPG